LTTTYAISATLASNVASSNPSKARCARYNI